MQDFQRTCRRGGLAGLVRLKLQLVQAQLRSTLLQQRQVGNHHQPGVYLPGGQLSTRSGPMPAGSPAVTASRGRAAVMVYLSSRRCSTKAESRS
jgi:hypothetical protein